MYEMMVNSLSSLTGQVGHRECLFGQYLKLLYKVIDIGHKSISTSKTNLTIKLKYD